MRPFNFFSQQLHWFLQLWSCFMKWYEKERSIKLRPLRIHINLVPRGPFYHALEKSWLLARSNDIPVLNGFVNTIDCDQNQSDLSDLTQSMRRVTGSPWIADFRCWTRPEVVILGADQKERGLWGREWHYHLLYCQHLNKSSSSQCSVLQSRCSIAMTRSWEQRVLFWWVLSKGCYTFWCTVTFGAQ